MKTVRTRFAPSPTGPLHIGGVRTALFSFLYAKQHGGKFILRIEDTDQKRLVKGAEQHIAESLQWCGIVPDEGVTEGGEYAPYRQSERRNIYSEYVTRLVREGHAYYAFDTAEQLASLRKEAEQKGSVFTYGVANREELDNSLNIGKEEAEKRLSKGIPYVVRFKVPEGETITVVDSIRGTVHYRSEELDDKVLVKADGLPTYHLANVVDDHLMEISHVIRGEEWLPSLPLHYLLYRALGWGDEIPQFAHLPLILNPSGKGKLSKRDGDTLGVPVFAVAFTPPDSKDKYRGLREIGYLPQAVVNMLALLGWTDAEEREEFTLSELAQRFSLERVSKAGAKFSLEKLRWLNHRHLAQADISVFLQQALLELEKRQLNFSQDYVARICTATKERITVLSEWWQQCYYFFEAPSSFDEKAVSKKWTAEVLAVIREKLIPLWQALPRWTAETLQEAVQQVASESGLSLSSIMPALRLCVVGKLFGADLPLVLDILGKEEVLRRLNSLPNS